MRRYLTAVLLMALALPFSACAQWYLFPGGRPANDSTTVDSRPDTVTVVSVPDSVTLADGVADSLSVVTAENDGIPVTSVMLLLPLRSTGTPNSNFLDFYCGVLTAADELSSDFHRYQIDILDCDLGLPAASRLEDFELVIGPVNPDDVQQLIPRMRNRYLVSPLDPKVSVLTDGFNVIQAPSGWEAQADEMVRWLGEDLRGGDTVVLLQSAEDSAGELAVRIAAKLSENGISYNVSSTPSSYEGIVRGSCRFVVASENEEFCASAVREIALMNLKGGHNIVYSTSRIRGTGDLEVESLHAAAARITASYYADPANPAVRRFAEQYRGLFKAEPSQWAFQGYDLMMYFGKLAADNPGLWPEELAATPGQGLQTDFRFDATGKNNTAVRRLKYNANNTITIIK